MGFQTAGFRRIFRGETRLAASATTGVAVTPMKLMLMVSTLNYQLRTFTTLASIQAHELTVTSGGYTAGGIALDDDVLDRVFVTPTDNSIGFRWVASPNTYANVFTSLVNAAGPIITGVALYDSAGGGNVILTAPFTQNRSLTLSATAQTLTITAPAAGFFGALF